MAITVSAAFAALGVLLATVMIVVQPKPIAIAPGLGTQRQGAETLVYAMAFLVLVPLVVVLGPRIHRRLAATPGASALPVAAPLLAAALTLMVIAVRVAVRLELAEPFPALLAATLLWWGLSAAVLARILSSRPLGSRVGDPRAPGSLWVIAGVGCVGAILAVSDLGSPDPAPVAAGLVPAVAGLVLAVRRTRLPALGRRLGWVVDGLCVLLLLLAIPDLVIVTPGAPGLSALNQYANVAIQFHQDFLLGPANQVLGGHGMLVDTSSQYGVGSIYFIAAFFKLVPISYGTFGLLDGLVTATYFIAGFAVLRVAGVSRLLSAAALALGVVALVYHRLYPVGSIVQEGPIRFGFPLAVTLAFVAAARWPHRRRAAIGAALGVLALASVWAFEALAYTGAVLALLVAADAVSLPAGGRLRWVARLTATGLAACVGAHIAFALFTLAAFGQLPEWGQYLIFLKVFLTGDLGTITYDFARWSPGIAVGAGYLLAALVLGLTARLAPATFAGRRPAFVALTGLTGYGIVLFYYFVDRSAAHVLVYVSLPLLLLVALWLSVLAGAGGGRLRAPGLAFGAVVAAVSVLVLTGAWSQAGDRLGESALAYAVPGTKSARNAYERLRDFPPFDASSSRGAALLGRYMPNERRSLVLTKSGLDTELLMRSKRSNALPLPDAVQDSFVGSAKFPLLREYVQGLHAGRRILLDRAQLFGLAALKRNPALGNLEDLAAGRVVLPLQSRTLEEIDRRFTLRWIYADDVFVVAELVSRRPG